MPFVISPASGAETNPERRDAGGTFVDEQGRIRDGVVVIACEMSSGAGTPRFRCSRCLLGY